MLDGAKPIDEILPAANTAPATKPATATTAPAAAKAPAGKATAASPAAAAKPAASSTAAAAPATAATATPPTIVVVTQPAAPATPAPPPGNNWGAGLLGLLILGVGGFYGLRYAQKKGVTVADSLQKLGVEMPQDGINGPATVSHLKPPPQQTAPLPPLPSLANLPEAAALGSGVSAAVASPSNRTGAGNLIGTLGPVEGKQLTVPAGAPLTMGRDTDNTLPLPDDTTVSRRHARIEAVPEGSGFQIVDEGSSNGTFVNGQRLTAGQPRTLAVGDEIQIGASRLRFEG
jgi:hypothetical protein